MNDIWLLEGSFATDMAFGIAAAAGTEPVTITYFTLPGKHAGEFARDPVYAADGGPAGPGCEELILTLEDFDKDFFKWCGSMFVSERMREVMALDASEVRFFEVDASRSAPLPRSKNYQIMQPDIVEDLSDPERSEYEMSRIVPDLPLTPTYVRRIAFRPGAAPKRDLFFDRFFSLELFCTEAFASRVLKAGCTGATFTDPICLANGDRFLRTRRGIEKVVRWDKSGEITELVEAID